MQIGVRTLTGKLILIECERSDTIRQLKEKVEDKEGIPPHLQRLMFGGCELQNCKELQDYSIAGGLPGDGSEYKGGIIHL